MPMALPNPGGGDPTWVFIVTGIVFVILVVAGAIMWRRRGK